MDNENKKFDVNNTSTQKTVRLKPLVKQPLVGENTTESQSVKKVATNTGAFPKVGTQTGRISTIATNTARVVRLNSTLRNSINNNAAGPNTTMMDFRTSEIQMVSPAQSAPVTTRPGAAQSVLNSLNLKPKVAEAAVVDSAPAAAAAPAAPAAESADDTKTAAVPKAPSPIKPSFNIPSAAPAAPAPAAPAAASADDNTQTAAVPKPAAVKPAFNINASASAASDSDDSTVKLKRPERPVATQTNSVVPTITAKPAASVAPAPAAPSLVKPSAAPTVKLNMNQNAGSAASAPTVPAMPAVEPPKAKLGLKKAETPAPAPEEVKKEEPKAEETAKADAENKEPQKAKKAKKGSVAAAAAAGAKVKKSAVPASQDMPQGFHFAVGFLTAIFVLAAATFCVIQYVNTYQPRLFGRYIQIPFMEQVGK